MAAAATSLPARPGVRHAILGAIVAAGLLVRALHAGALADTAFPRMPLVFTASDMHGFWEWAERIRGGDLLGYDTYHPSADWLRTMALEEGWDRWLRDPAVFQWAPLYPYLVAAMLALSRGSLLGVLLIQLVLGSVQPVAVYLLGRRLLDARVGLVAAALVAFHGPLVFYQGVLLRDWIPPILEPLTLVAILRARDTDRLRDWGLAGLMLAVALLTKETAVLFVPVVVAWVVWERWPAGGRAARALGGLAAALLLGLSPLVARNIAVGAPVLAISNRAIPGVIDGNNVAASPVGYGYSLAVNRQILERADGTLLSVVRETLATYEGHWGRFLAKEGLKLRGLVDPYEVPNNTSWEYGREISPLLGWLPRFGLLFPLGAAGLVLSVRRWRRHLLVYGYLGSTVAGILVGTVLARYRLLLVPVLAVCGAWLVVSVVEAAVRRRTRTVLGLAALTGAIAVAQHLWLPLPRPWGPARHQEYVFAAQVYAGDGRFDRAVAEIDRMERRMAGNPILRSPVILLRAADYRAGWAAGLYQAGRREEARREVERAEAAYLAMGESLPPSALYNLGQLHAALGGQERARHYLRRFVELEPEGAASARARDLLARLGHAGEPSPGRPSTRPAPPR